MSISYDGDSHIIYFGVDILDDVIIESSICNINVTLKAIVIKSYIFSCNYDDYP